MAYLVIPKTVGSRSAQIWLGVVNENLNSSQIRFTVNDTSYNLNPSWHSWISRDARNKIYYQLVSVENLSPRKQYQLKLLQSGNIKATGKITSLPDQLPTIDDKPFTVLLGSCFDVRNDQGGKVGSTYMKIPSGVQPDIKVLCGDQVYLDSPWHRYLISTHNEEELETNFFKSYIGTWAQKGVLLGFNYLLSENVTYFSSDDHEFWNNAPFPGIYVRDTWFEGRRKKWWAIATKLYNIFQGDLLTYTFNIGSLSFFLADSRINRDTSRFNFMSAEDFDNLHEWVSNLEGPGVLVLGQPILTNKSGFSGRFSDFNLPDFNQYGELAKLLLSSKHSMIILTGDVHFARIAEIRKPNGVEIIEIISSPLQLVDKMVGGKWFKAPSRFPSFDIPGVPSTPVTTLESFQFFDNHFLTIEFNSTGSKVKIGVRLWPIVRLGELTRSRTVYEKTLQ